ncbi:hypothetical protein YC2023_122526 [Brassica napus]
MNVLWDQAINEFYRKFSKSADTHVMLLVTTVNTKHICVTGQQAGEEAQI